MQAPALPANYRSDREVQLQVARAWVRLGHRHPTPVSAQRITVLRPVRISPGRWMLAPPLPDLGIER